MKWFLAIVLACSICGSQAQTLKDGEMPQMPVFPEIPAPLPVGSVKMGSSDSKLKWRQTTDGLVITCPKKLDFATSLVFKIEVRGKR